LRRSREAAPRGPAGSPRDRRMRKLPGDSRRFPIGARYR